MPASELLLRAYNTVLRTFGGPYRARTYFGATMLCDPGDLIQHHVLHFGVWEPNASNVIETNLAPGDVCVDVGANVGYDTLLASFCVGPAGKVVAVEASRPTFDLLTQNLDENHARNIRLVHAAVSDKPGVLSLYSGPAGNKGRTTTLPDRDLRFEGEVEALPLDQILTGEECERVALIKIDIEGAEPPVMRRLLATLDLYPRLQSVVVEISPDDQWASIFAEMRAQGFSAFAIPNDYSRSYYLASPKPEPLMPLLALPQGQMDVLFKR